MGLPVNIAGVDSFPIRAIAIEDWPKEEWPEN
jgi:kynurenine formamidase